MLKRALFISLTILFIFASIGIADAQHPEITATLKATPESYTGKCPAVIKFEGNISVKNITRPPLKVQYKFIRSDGAFAPVETLIFEKDGSKKVSTTWTLGGPGLPTYSGWEAVKVVYPQDVESNKANFKIKCEAEAKPTDLTIKITNCPKSAKAGQELGATFQVTATNHGDIAVKDVAVDIVLRKDTSCPVPAPYAVYSPNFSNGVLLKGGREHVSLNPGQTLNVKLNGTNTIPADIPSGSYYLCAVIDAGDKVKEADEKNNCSCCPLKIAGAGEKSEGQLPDLIIADIYLDKDCQVVVKVKNFGPGPVPDEVWTVHKPESSSVYISIDGKGWGGATIWKFDPGKALQSPGGEATYTSTLKVTGTAMIKATVDHTKQVKEANEGNNQRTEKLTCKSEGVSGKPDLTIPSVKFEKVKSLVDSQGQPYWIFNVIITVKNQGTGAAGPFKLLLERNIGPGGTYTIACMTCEIDVSGLTAGQTLTLPPRQFNNANKMNSLFRATADSKNTIVESNEANNMNAEGFTP